MTLQEQLMQKWHPVLQMTSHIYSKTGWGELAYFAQEASTANRIVEIGTLFGRSAKMMLLANQNAKLWCVDIFEQDGTYETAQYFLRSEIYDKRCVILRSQSDEAWRLVELELNGEMLDLVLVDDGHEKADVIRDVNSFFPLLRSGGLIIGHDLDPGSGVEQAVKELFPGLPSYWEPVSRVWAYRKP